MAMTCCGEPVWLGRRCRECVLRAKHESQARARERAKLTQAKQASRTRICECGAEFDPSSRGRHFATCRACRALSWSQGNVSTQGNTTAERLREAQRLGEAERRGEVGASEIVRELGPMSRREVAAALALSEERVRKIEERALARLAQLARRSSVLRDWRAA